MSAATATATPSPLSNSHPIDTPLDHRSILNVVGWSLAVLTTLVVITRLGTKLTVSRALELDDLLIVISLILAFAQTGTLSSAVANGLGLVGTAVVPGLAEQEKAIYAFNILFVCSQFFAKASILVFIRNLTPDATHQFFIVVTLIAAGCWAITAIMALLFQCHGPSFWQTVGNQCVDRVALFTVIEVLNALLDLVLITLPCLITWNLQLRIKRRLVLIFSFFTRLAVIAAIIAQVVILYHGPPAADPFLSWSFALVTQLAEYFSISSACGTYLKPFLQNIASGMIFNDDIRRREGIIPSFKLSYNSSSRASPRNRESEHESIVAPLSDINLIPRPDAGPYSNHISADRGRTSKSTRWEDAEVGDAESGNRSMEGNRDAGITQTKSYSIDHMPA